tara:strand:- start:7983 stop:9317 length:1335 start_codon:yes stop_codon:yes gene_type:complete
MSTTSLKCECFRRGDVGYEAARRATCRNVHLPDLYPDIIVQAANEEDVIAAVRLANASEWKIGVRSGGHSWSCNHVREGGMLLDVSRLNAVTVDELSMCATAGPGCRGNELDDQLAERQLFFPVGHCHGVGLGGFLLQGGFGWYSRVLGMACESVLAIDYVDANGELRRASPGENADMYWAARGAGPGFCGIITRFHLKLYQRPPVIGARLATYSADKFEKVIRWARDVGPSVPDSVELMFVFSRCIPAIDGPGILVIAAVFADTPDQAQRDLSFLETRPGGSEFCSAFEQMSLATLTRETMAHYPDNHRHIVDNMWTHASADALLPALKSILDALPLAPAHFIWVNWMPRLHRPEMAFSLEDDIYIALYGLWPDGNSGASVSQWVSDGIANLLPHSTGIQLADENLARRQAPFMAEANRARLEQIRSMQDPTGRFHSYGSPAG